VKELYNKSWFLQFSSWLKSKRPDVISNRSSRVGGLPQFCGEDMPPTVFPLLVDALSSGEYDSLAQKFVPVGLTPRKLLDNDFFRQDSRYGSLTCFIDVSLSKHLSA